MAETDGKTSPSAKPLDAPVEPKRDLPDSTKRPIPAVTLQSGAALQQTWKLRGQPEAPVVAGAKRAQQATPDLSAVHALIAKATAAASDGAKTTQGSGPSLIERLAATERVPSEVPKSSAEPRNPAQQFQVPTSGRPAARSGSSAPHKLARTLRMEIAIGSLPQAASADAPAKPLQTPAPRAQPKPASNAKSDFNAPVLAGTMRRIGNPHDAEVTSSRNASRDTDPIGKPAQTARSPRAEVSDAYPPSSSQRDHARSGSTRHPSSEGASLGADFPLDIKPSIGRPSVRATVDEPDAHTTKTRARKPGELTTVMRRQPASSRDWVFIATLAGALAITASMLLSYRRPHGTRNADAASVEHTISAAEQPTTDEAAQPKAAVPLTELRSDPPGAEVIVGGAVIGNTPVRVAHAEFDTDYLLRLGGYEPQLVRVTSASPNLIQVTLSHQAH
jgi:hypothetical protein